VLDLHDFPVIILRFGGKSMTHELCPFCAKPITREYGSFRCKSCARSSEDVLDLERKERAAAVRKAQRAAKSTPTSKAATPKAGKSQLIALAIARHKERKLAGTATAPAPARKKGSRTA
jgi:uncharacterized Zn finger protein (UPF0148 family)